MSSRQQRRDQRKRLDLISLEAQKDDGGRGKVHTPVVQRKRKMPIGEAF